MSGIARDGSGVTPGAEGVPLGVPDAIWPWTDQRAPGPGWDGTQRVSDDVRLGRDTWLGGFVNLYGCEIGDRSRIGPFVEVQRGASIGRDCKISSHSFVCEGVTIEDEVFVGHGVIFTNDVYPRATVGGRLQGAGDWSVVPTLVGRGASIGSGVTVLPGVIIGRGAIIGAGSVVTRDIPDGVIAMGNPCRVRRRIGQPSVEEMEAD